jgi:hypothetical protein
VQTPGAEKFAMKDRNHDTDVASQRRKSSSGRAHVTKHREKNERFLSLAFDFRADTSIFIA